MKLTYKQTEQFRKAGESTADEWVRGGVKPDPNYEFTGQGDVDFVIELATSMGLNWSDPDVQQAVWKEVRVGYLDAIDQEDDD